MHELNNLIKFLDDGILASVLTRYFDFRVPKYFWTSSASTTGKYHPDIDLGPGGLVRHTRMTLLVAKELFELDMFYDLWKSHNEIYSALIIHDSFKRGEEDESEHTLHDHPLRAANNFLEFSKTLILPDEYIEKCELISELVASHMGQWTGSQYSDIVLPYPDTAIKQFVHLCDYIASRKFIGNFDKYESKKV